MSSLDWLFLKLCWINFLEFSEHSIYELELLPTLVAIRNWAEKLKRCHVVFYLDNTEAHSALVRADGATCVAAGLSSFGLLPWFGRVPSIRIQPTMPRDLWLSVAKHFQVVLPAHLSQRGIQTGAPETHHRKT